MDVSAMGGSKGSSRAGWGREFDKPIDLPNRRDAPHDLGSIAKAF